MTDAELILREVLDRIIAERKYKKRDVKVNQISSGGANFTSVLFNVNVATDVEDLELFAKVGIINDATRKQINGDWIYKTEAFFYNKLMKIYEELQDKHNVPEEHRFVFPKCYGINTENGKETVVMENLKAKGFKDYNRFKSMDWEHAAPAVEVLARFHALSFSYEKERPEEFKEVTADMCYKIGVQETDESMRPLWMRIINGAVNAVKEEHQEKVKAVLMVENPMGTFNKPIGKPVIAHGDYRLSNLLFKKEDDTMKTIAVDYQTIHAGCPVGDLIYFVVMGSDQEFRKQHFDQLMDHYYEHLCRSLNRLNVDPVEVYPRETFDAHLKKLLPTSVLMGAIILPVVTGEASTLPKLDENCSVENFAMEPNELFTSRFSGIVEDCVRWGAI